MSDHPLSVSLDTNIFKGCRYDLHETGALQLLKNMVDDNKIKLYISDIVARETERHIKLDVSKAIKELGEARKEISKYISPTIVKDTLLSPIFDFSKINTIEETALTNFRNFLKDCNAIHLDNKGIDVEPIIEDYFNGNAPFESNEAKKDEFPDAFIISRLKKEFNKSKPVWIISGDEGFKKALSNEDGFNCVSTIKDLLDMINKQDEMYPIIKQAIEDEKLYEEIRNGIKKKIKSDDIEVFGLDCDRKGHCEGYEYDDSFITDVSIQGFNLSSIDEIKKDIVHLTVLCKADISVTCSYNDYENAIWDSDKKEYMFLFEEQIDEEHEAELECDLSLNFNYDNGDIEFSLLDISYDLVLDQYSRTSRTFVEPEDPEISAKADMMDALEGFYNHS